MSVSASFEALALFAVLAARLPGLLTLELVASGGRTTLAGVVMGSATWGPWSWPARPAPGAHAGAGTAVAGVAWRGALALRAPELIDLLGAVQRRRAPRVHSKE